MNTSMDVLAVVESVMSIYRKTHYIFIKTSD